MKEVRKFLQNDNMQLLGDGDGIQKYLGQITGASTVPRVFIGGKCIGGCDSKFDFLLLFD
jgi:glutaredoxin